MPLIDFATAVKSLQVYESAGYAVAAYDPDPALLYAFDTRGSYAAIVVVNCGPFTSTGKLEIVFQESVDATTWTDILDIEGATAALPVIAESPSGAEVPDEAQYMARINFVQKLRYIGVKATVTSARAQFSVSALLLSYDTRNNDTPSVIA